MKSEIRAVVAALAVLSLSACQGEKKAAAGGVAGGEILPGSTSDAMLPLDTIRSQPPLAQEATEDAKSPGKAKSGSASGAGSAAPAMSEAAPPEPLPTEPALPETTPNAE